MMTAICLVGLFMMVRKLKGLWATLTGDPARLGHWVMMGRHLMGR